jgi:outer membrane protein assembly factor BamE
MGVRDSTAGGGQGMHSSVALWENATPRAGVSHDTGTLLPMQKPLPLLMLAALLTGCSLGELRNPFSVYRIDIPQGNIVNQEMVDQLQPGMNKRQVRFVMGTPLILDTFEPDRWDYLRSLETRRNKKRTQERVSLFFENDRLVRIEGDLAPGGSRPSTGDTVAPASAVEALDAQAKEAATPE